MLVYRIQKMKHSQSREKILSGEGAYRVGGRWNLKGIPLIYTCQTPELAVLETLVHLQTSDPESVPNLALITLQIPDESILKVSIESLPNGWNKIKHPKETQIFTKNWIEEKKFLVMEIPSIVMQISKNYLINPLHPNIEKVNIIQIQDYILDYRLIIKDEPKKMKGFLEQIMNYENQ